MNITITFKRIRYHISFGKKSADHSQIYNFSLSKEWLDENGEGYSGKMIFKF